MQKIIFIKDYKNYKEGDIKEISNNVAHGLVERGIAQHYNVYNLRILKKPPVDKMMRADLKENKSDKHYKVK